MGDQTELRVVHALRLKGFADTSVIAEAAEVDEVTARQVLDSLAEAKRARFREGRMTGWTLMPAGRTHGESLLAADLEAHGNAEALAAVYRRFLEHNQGFLRLCTEWQVRYVGGAPLVEDGQQVINDHTDPGYDGQVLDRLAAMDTAMQPVCADLAALLPRFHSYGPRFAAALAKVQSGDTDWFTKPVIDSYHTVWFELHEDLLASLGIERAQEGHA